MRYNLKKISVVKKLVLYDLHYTYISATETLFFLLKGNTYYCKLEVYILYYIFRWQDRRGYPRSIMMQKIVNNFYEHLLKNQKILQNNNIYVLLVSKES